MKPQVKEKKQTIGRKEKQFKTIEQSVAKWLKHVLHSYTVYLFQPHLFHALIV